MVIFLIQQQSFFLSIHHYNYEFPLGLIHFHCILLCAALLIVR